MAVRWPRVLVAALFGASIAAAQSAPGARNLLNKPAPDFTRTDLSGRALRLDALRGKVVLLNFWATWCAPCQLEMPVFSAWQREYGSQGLAVVGVSMDDDAATARRVVERLKVDYPVTMGDARLGMRYGGVLGLPLTFLIDRDGVVRERFQGVTDAKAIEKQVQALLVETSQGKPSSAANRGIAR
jgi:peroxiredoxin